MSGILKIALGKLGAPTSESKEDIPETESGVNPDLVSVASEFQKAASPEEAAKALKAFVELMNLTKESPASE